LLFIPAKAPLDLFIRDAHRGLHLYVKRVFITDTAEDLMPAWLRFMRGVVDSEDLPLNISREVLQQNRQIQMIRKRLTKKILDTLAEMRTAEPESYRTFWKEFGAVVKEGIFQDHENREAILDISLFSSTHSGDELTSLKEYIARMKEGQENIYYITGDDRMVLENSPHLEAFRQKGYEVLLLADPVDGIWTTTDAEFDGRAFRSAARGMVELGTEEEKREAEEKRSEGQREFGAVLMAIQENLNDRIKEVRLSSRLTSSAVCLVADEHDLSPQMERLMRAMGQEVPHAKPIMELNPDHPLLARMQALYQKDALSRILADYAELLYGQAALAEGMQVPDPARFSRLVADLMVKAAGED
jgi:molecular chaperone HtpG